MSSANRDVDPERYLRGHVYNEMRFCLVAATTWSACVRTREDHGVDHLPVLAMDSAFLHARNLFEFWRGERGNIRRVFGSDGPSSDLYVDQEEGLKKALHRKLLHMDPDREFEPAETADDRLHLRVEEVAHEVLTCWDLWRASDGMAPHAVTLDAVRRDSVDQAASAAVRLGIDPVFSHAVR